MSTFNNTIRRQLGFGLIPWNTPEHEPSMPAAQPQSGRTARETGGIHTASPAATLNAGTIAPDVR